MDLSATTLVAICARVGLVAFAFAGVEVGLRRRLDVFGLAVMGMVGATGGGVVRDVLLGRLPLLLAKDDYILIAAAASLVAIPLLAREQRPLRDLLVLADALGLGRSRSRALSRPSSTTFGYRMSSCSPSSPPWAAA